MKYLFTILLFMFVSYSNINAKSPSALYPMGITPTHVYDKTNTLNAYLELFLLKAHVRISKPLPKLERSVRPMVLFQLGIALVEMLHDYELKSGRRPIPVITSSPIQYYPADIDFVVDLLIQRLKLMAEAEKIYHVSTPKPRKDTVRTDYDVYESLLHAYIKLAALNGFSLLTANQNYVQLHRAVEETGHIIDHEAKRLKSSLEKRLLISSKMGIHPTGPHLVKVPEKVQVSDVYETCIKIRQLLNQLLSYHEVIPLPLPLFDYHQKYDSLDVFIQVQQILADLSELKRVLGVAESAPVTKQAEGMRTQHVLQEAMAVLYMLERYQAVFHPAH